MQPVVKMKANDAYLIIPYVPRGRDFDSNYRAFTFPYFDMVESVPYYATKDSKLEIPFCNCMLYTKCQSVTIHHPITLKLLHQLIIDANKQQSQYLIAPLYLRCAVGNIGRTSSSWFVDVVYKQITLASFVCVNVHIDPKVRRPTDNCQKINDHKRYCQRVCNDQMRDEQQSHAQQLRASTDMLVSKLAACSNKPIYEREFELRPIDMDWNKHTNQAVYARRIEDVLYHYHKEFQQNLYGITYFTHLFKHEMLIKFDGSLKCKVTILIHENIENHRQRIIGCMSQDDQVCMQYMVILTPTRNIKQLAFSKL